MSFLFWLNATLAVADLGFAIYWYALGYADNALLFAGVGLLCMFTAFIEYRKSEESSKALADLSDK